MANGTWKIARGKGSAQLPLAIVVVLAVTLLLAGKAHFLPFDRARAALTDWARPTLEVVNAPALAVSNWLSGIGHFFDVYSENIRLKQENARLRQWQGAAGMLEARVKRYQLLLNAVTDPAATSTTAKVIGRSSHPFAETMILDAGTRDGVKPGQTVADASGVLGRIYLAGDRTSWVILLTDLNSRIPVTIQPGNEQAILAGDNTDTPALEALAQGAKIKQGQEVVTSGNGGLLPPGLPVGVLVQDAGGFRVALFADPGTAEDVRILDFKQAEMPSPTISDLPASAAGFKPAPPPEPAQASPPPQTAVDPPNRSAASVGATAAAAGANQKSPAANPSPQTSADQNADDDQTDQ